MARIQSLVTHTVFGLGLYAAGWLVNLLRNLDKELHNEPHPRPLCPSRSARCSTIMVTVVSAVLALNTGVHQVFWSWFKSCVTLPVAFRR
jgi:hypothetical protein